MKLNLDRWGETILGAIVAAVAIGFFAFAAAQAGQSGPSGKSYDLVANFQRVDGISVGSDVRISGVKVGVVRALSLNTDNFKAKVTLAIEPSVQVLDDSVASVRTDGLLGGAYISIEPTGVNALKPGEEIANTQGSIDLLTVMSSAMSGMSGGNNNANSTEAAHP